MYISSKQLAINIMTAIASTMITTATVYTATAIFITSFALQDEQNFRILVQQGEHELKKGAFHTALSYLDKAVKVMKD